MVTRQPARPLRRAVRRGFIVVYGIAAIGGSGISIARGLQGEGAFFYVFAALNAVFWIGLLMLVLVVDDRRRRLARLDEEQEHRPSS